MATKSKGEVKTASVLAFERKLDPSDALMYSCDWEKRKNASAWQAIALREKSVRGTISNRLKNATQDGAKLDAQIQSPNLQTVDVASLSAEHDTLVIQWTMRVLPGVGEPSACNSERYRSELMRTIDSYKAEVGLAELAHRYATNLANGRFAWRNRVGAEAVEVRVEQVRDGQAAQSWTFNGLEVSTRSFDHKSNDLKGLANTIEAGLTGSEHVLLSIQSFIRVGRGQEVFPSQELILDKAASKKSKTLYSVDGIAGLHSQKIGNALRTIDDWYPVNEEGDRPYGPIAAEPYGSVTTLGAALRQPRSKTDFYTLLDGWVLAGKVPSLEEQHFVISILIRGGVFGEA